MENEEKKVYNGKPVWVDSIRIFGDITTWVAVPIVLALVIGKYLDKRFGTDPVIFLSLAGLGFIVTAWGIFKITKEYTEKTK